MGEILIPKFFISTPSRDNIFSIEGIDGAGKTTQARALVDALLSKKYNAIYVTNPTETIVGRFLRQNLSTLPAWQRIFLFLLDMIDILNSHKDPSQILIWDRYIHSTLVSNKDMPPSQVAPLLQGLPKPKIAFLLTINPETVLNNRVDSLHNHSTDLEWQKLKQSRYGEILRTNSSEFCVIDGNLPPEKITEIILDKIISELP